MYYYEQAQQKIESSTHTQLLAHTYVSSLNYHKGTTTTFADGEFKVEANKSFEPFFICHKQGKESW